MKISGKTSKHSSLYERFRKTKAGERKRDWDQLARRVTTPERVQAANALFTRCAEFQILNLAETMDYFRRRPRHSRS